MLSYLRSMELTEVSIDEIVALAKQKQTKWCLVSKILFWLKFFVKKKVMTIDEWSHCFNGDNCERAWVRVVTETCVLDE